MRLQVGKGMDQYLQQLGNLEMIAPQSMGKAIYEGADIVADAIKKGVQSLRVSDEQYAEKVTGIRTIQKQGLIDSLGIAKATTDNGYRNVKIGFDGYNKLTSQKYPQGQPNAMIARSVNNGTYFRTATHFVDRAVRRSKAQAEQAMAKQAEIQFKKYGGE